jgi:hypothetical protein
MLQLFGWWCTANGEVCGDQAMVGVRYGQVRNKAVCNEQTIAIKV